MSSVSNVMSMLRRLRHQVGFDLLIFRRNPAATFFTVVFPLIFLVIFTSVFGDADLGNGITADTRYVPGILALAIISATLVNLAITMTARRERGVLKRVRGTPIPPWIFVASQCVASFVLSAVMTVLIVVIGGLLFGVGVNPSSLPSLAVTVLIGAASFAAMGLALTSIIPSEDAAPAVTNAVVLPLYFISDVFIPGDSAPEWIRFLGSLFPVRHLSHGLQPAFDPTIEGAVWPVDHWAVMLAWGAVGLVVSLTTFRWTPRR